MKRFFTKEQMCAHTLALYTEIRRQRAYDRVLSRLQPRLACLGEFGWKIGRSVPLSPNLLACAVRAR